MTTWALWCRRSSFASTGRLIFAKVMHRIVAGKGCDVITVSMALGEKVDDAMTYLDAMARRCPSAANIARYADLVRATARWAARCWWGRSLGHGDASSDRTVLQLREVAQGNLATLAETRSEEQAGTFLKQW